MTAFLVLWGVYGYTQGTVFGNYAVLNGQGRIASLTSTTSFDWTGAYFSQPHDPAESSYDYNTIEFKGYRNGEFLHTGIMDLSYAEPLWYEAGFTGIDTLVLVAQDGDQEWFSMDDFTYTREGFNAIVPEPSTMILLSLGIVGIAGINRRIQPAKP